MLKKTSIKSLYRITALTMAFLIFAVTGAQSYSLAAGAETLQRDQEAVTSSVENTNPGTITDETTFNTNQPQTDDQSQSQNNVEETPSNENYHNVNIGDFDIIGEDFPIEESKAVWVLPWVGWEIGKVIVWLAAGAAVGVTVVEGFVEAQAFVKELSKSKQQNKPKYYRVKFNKTHMYVGKPMTDQEAYDYLAKTPFNDIWTPDYNSARIIAAKFGTVDGPKAHNDTGYNDTRYWYHFHGVSPTYRTGHIFYGTGSLLGLRKR
ncbi:hypothetical protein [Paenibacillus sp. FSL H7-689]|uniref:hypothetical protein n=1 Tax=Paenibacillus sp. FSL H7-689 TaxID=1227349 RepID=UPI0003E27C93|nr:hypothetical protein [Paenibacillus sp. FSL H7-689]ETT44738.1 hypothetical protein C170_22590 [Paenibacillus sp. FSL H7-689]